MKIGTIGTGPIVDLFLEAIQSVDRVACTAVCSRQEATARALADKHGVQRIYTDYNALLSDKNVDFIYIASPNSLHFQQAKQALDMGKHVIVEKPFTTTIEETLILIDLAKSHRLFLFEAITTIHNPNYKIAKEKLELLGTIKLVQCNYAQYSSRYDQLLSGVITNIFNPAFSGGCLYDLNIYNLHFVTGLFGLAKSVQYFPNLAENGIDTSGIAVLTYDDFVSTCAGAKDSCGPSFATIQGTKGFIQFNSSANRCQRFEVSIGGRIESINEQSESNRLVYELKAFADCFQRQDLTTCYAWLEHTLNVMKTAVAARKSAGIIFSADKPEGDLTLPGT